MKCVILSVLTVIWTVSIAGCGTITDHLIDGPIRHVPMPYGGVEVDVQSIVTTAKTVTTGDVPPLNPTALIEEVSAVLAIADLPLSAIGDTILLPVTLRNASREHIEDIPITCSGSRPPIYGFHVGPDGTWVRDDAQSPK
jgi:uncharacterized protein YceK